MQARLVTSIDNCHLSPISCTASLQMVVLCWTVLKLGTKVEALDRFVRATTVKATTHANSVIH